MIEHETKMEGFIELHIIFHLKGKRCIDTDNLLKGLIDCLKEHCFSDDACIVKIIAERELDCKEDTIELTILPYVKKV